jgi:hypothetical protein
MPDYIFPVPEDDPSLGREHNLFLQALADQAPDLLPVARGLLADLTHLHNLESQEFAHRMQMDRERLRAEQDAANREFDIQFKLTKRGQNLAIVAIFFVFLFGTLSMYHGESWAAAISAIFGGGSLASMVWAFTSGRHATAKSNNKKSNK